MSRRGAPGRWTPILALSFVTACEPPPAPPGLAVEPGIELVSPQSGVDIPLIQDGADLFLELLVVADVSGLEFVPPVEGADDVPGEGHFLLSVNGAFDSAPSSRVFAWRSEPNAFAPGDTVQVRVSLASNSGADLDAFEDWLSVVEFDVVAPEVAPTEVRLIHASHDVGPVDVYAAGSDELLFEDLAYGDATSWTTLEAAPLAVSLRAAGDSPNAPPLHTDILDLEPGARVNFVAAGLLDGDAADGLRIVPVVEGWGNDVPGRARVRFVHAGADLPAVSLDGVATSDEIRRFASSDAEGETVDIGGGERLELLGALGGGDLTSFTTPQLAPGDDVLLIATGLYDELARRPEGLKLLVIGADGPLEPILQDPQLFVLHGSGDSGSLELCSGTDTIVANVLYSQMEPARVSPGTYDLGIFSYPAGCTGAPLNGAGNRTTFDAGERYLMLLTGEQTADPGEASIQAASFKDEFTLGDDDNARVKFVHGASYSQVYVGVVFDDTITAPNVLTDPIEWRSTSVEVQVSPGPLTLGIADAADEQIPPPYAPIVTFEYAALGGERQWGIVAGDPSPDDEDDQGLEVLVVDSAPKDWTVAVVAVE